MNVSLVLLQALCLTMVVMAVKRETYLGRVMSKFVMVARSARWICLRLCHAFPDHTRTGLLILPTRRVDCIILSCYYLSILVSAVCTAYAMQISISAYDDIVLHLVGFNLRKNFLLGAIFSVVSSFCIICCSTVGVYVANYKQYSWYRKHIFGCAGVLAIATLPLIFFIECHQLAATRNIDESTFLRDQLLLSLKKKFTGDLRTTNDWSVYWNYFQLKNGCCGVDSASDYWYGINAEYFYETVSSKHKFSVFRSYPRSCCNYSHSYVANNKVLEEWLDEFLSFQPGSQFKKMPSPSLQDVGFTYCVNKTIYNSFHLSEQGCLPLLARQFILKTKEIAIVQLLPFILLGVINAMSIWYLYNQQYGLPTKMDLYAANKLAGLHRESEEDSEVLQVGFPQPTLGKAEFKMSTLLQSGNQKGTDTTKWREKPKQSMKQQRDSRSASMRQQRGSRSSEGSAMFNSTTKWWEKPKHLTKLPRNSRPTSVR